MAATNRMAKPTARLIQISVLGADGATGLTEADEATLLKISEEAFEEPRSQKDDGKYTGKPPSKTAKKKINNKKKAN